MHRERLPLIFVILACIAKDFAWREWWSVVRSLESYLSHARWMNPLSSTGIVDCKPYQLFLAQEVGLTVPKTTITNNPEAVSKMFDKADNGRVVFKTLTRLFIPPDKQVLTREIQRDFTTLSRISITKCPAIYQELVERRSDLRITVVGDKVFPVRIDSQALDEERDRLDWRRCQEKEHLYTKVQVLLFPLTHFMVKSILFQFKCTPSCSLFVRSFPD